jgi:hypothetical protein
MKLKKLAGALAGAALCTIGLTGLAAAGSPGAASQQPGSPCDNLSIPENSVEDMYFDPGSGHMAITYLDNGESRTVEIDAEDPSCKANPSTRRIIEPARATAANERRSVCAAAKDYLEHGATDEKSRHVNRTDAERVDRDCRSGNGG